MPADRPDVPRLNVEDLLDSPDRAGAVISPDGSKFAYLAPWRDRLNVWIQDLDGEGEARCVTTDSRRSVLRHHWTDDPRRLLYEQDGDGDENYHLHRVDLDHPDSDAVDLTPFPGARVLQVNHRGSTGYGKSFLKAGIGELAGAMHDDLVDAVGWAVERGYADPARVAVFGGSYGGYAARVGVAFTPGLFAAAVDFCGPSNLVTALRNVPDFAKPYLTNNWHLYAGDPDDPAQEADLRARSPLSRVADIRTPLLVVQGANDARVRRSESDQIVEALRNRGVDVEYLVKDDEGHSFANPENTIDMYRAADRFLARHLRDDEHR